MKKLIYILSLVLILSCSKDNACVDYSYIGQDKIDKIDIFPSSPVLLRDGKSKLNFEAICYYKLDGQLYRYKDDRIDKSQIQITASSGEKFNLADGFTTKSALDTISFVGTLSNIKSSTVKVRIDNPLDKEFTRLDIPVDFFILTTTQDAESAKAINKDILNKALDRINKLFNNEIEASPCGASTNIHFKLNTIVRLPPIKEDEDTDVKKEYLSIVKNECMANAEQHLTIWVCGYKPSKDNDETPKFIVGDANAIPGLDLKSVASKEEIQDIKPTYVGMFLSFLDIYRNENRTGSPTLEYLFGSFFGLLPTGVNPTLYAESKDKSTDLDFCRDTYSYLKGDYSIYKRSLPINGKAYIFKSTNIMDDYSSCSYISVDQAKRIRKVIELCPFRQFGN